MPDTPEKSAEMPKTITIEYIKSNLFRSLQADGAFVGGRPNGLTITFFSDRLPIPKVVVHDVNPDGSLGKEVPGKRIGKEGIIRDTEISVGLTLETAKSLVKLINDIITQLETSKPNNASKKVQ